MKKWSEEKVNRIKRSNGNRHSTIRVTNKKDVIKIGDFIYDGLKRKYDKFLLIKN